MSSPHHRHQASLEGLLDFSPRSSLTLAERAAARHTLLRVAQYFENLDDARGGISRGVAYSQPRLIRYTFEYALSDESRDIFLRAFFSALALSIGEKNEQLDFAELQPLFRAFAEYLMDHFFLPLKASTRRTPQPSPAYHSAVLRAQGTEPTVFVGTPDRLSALRGACLVRDRHRCVISRAFSTTAFFSRSKKDGDNAQDDDGVLFSQLDMRQVDRLEVAHILPHALTKSSTGPRGGDLDKSREAALAILNMFDSGVAHLINGVDVDRPRNALTLSSRYHDFFGAFEIYFDAVPGEYNTYQIQSFFPSPMARALGLPVTRTLFVTENRTIDPPSPRLLAVHRAIAHILHMSGAGEYIDRVLEDMEDSVVRSNGTSELGRMVSLGLGDWICYPVS
ncbi:hypothetical protein SPI_03608 [Niveomyces insectorum RCEF 264]|uniref:HNH nuclease domain-containing protein n=1 Tax=Niveomyces insectorum RCEF 264 TaxID=1081102 RepID=A0A167W7V6_9HYPO|nr:hypothetical protein SPI_03608 [Niveomyces insectorum RCEF 264]